MISVIHPMKVAFFVSRRWLMKMALSQDWPVVDLWFYKSDLLLLEWIYICIPPVLRFMDGWPVITFAWLFYIRKYAISITYEANLGMCLLKTSEIFTHDRHRGCTLRCSFHILNCCHVKWDEHDLDVLTVHHFPAQFLLWNISWVHVARQHS